MKQYLFLAIFFPFVFFLVGILYRDFFSVYFFQDDWFTLRISKAETLREFFLFFLPRTDVIYYRPLGMQVPFFFLQKFFGINFFSFRLLTFLTHALNVFLVFLLIKILAKNLLVALMVCFFYATSAVHFTPFFWAATYSFMLGPTFFFLSFISFLKKKNFWTVCLYLAGLLTNEIVAVLPLVLIFYKILYQEKEKKISILPPLLFLFSLSLFLFRFSLFPPPIFGNYKVELGKNLITNFKNYFLWSFNWPEEIKNQFINFFSFNPHFIQDFRGYFQIFLGSFAFSIFFFYGVPFFLFFRQKKILFLKEIIFGIFWCVIGISLVLVFSQHAFSYYLPISLVGLFFFSACLLSYFLRTIAKNCKTLGIIFFIIFFTVWTFSSFTTINFNLKVHWAAQRAHNSKTLINKAKKIYHPPESGIYIIYVENLLEKRLSLNNQDAFKVFFGNEKVITIYTTKNLLKDREVL